VKARWELVAHVPHSWIRSLPGLKTSSHYSDELRAHRPCALIV
jgi:hypothetical protein